jgi:hypothetical protein
MSAPEPPPFTPPHATGTAPPTGHAPTAVTDPGAPPPPAPPGRGAPAGFGTSAPGSGPHTHPGGPYGTPGLTGVAGPSPRPAAGPTPRTGWVIAAFLLFWPLAIPALLASQRAARALGAGDVAAAQRESDSARSWSLGAVVLGAVLQVGYVVTLVALLTSGMLAAAEMANLADAPTSTEDVEQPAAPEESADAEDTAGEDVTTEDTAGEVADDPAAVEAVDTEFVDLAAGDCFVSDDLPEESFSVPVIPCDVEHQSEIFAVTELPDGEYAGDDATWQLADDYCLGQFEDYVGTTYEESELIYWPFYPSKDNWVWGDHTVQCVLEPYEGRVTGSLQGSAR